MAEHALTVAYRRLLLATTLLAGLVVGLGAYVRLADAGLGCPDWPGCYGHLLGVPAVAPDLAKAWKEMIHRYAAGTLGLLILALAVQAGRIDRRPAPAETGLLLLVAAQALLGMWTVTLLLKPLIVTLHLLGGMATWATLVALLHRAWRPRAPPLSAAGRVALALVFVQIGLGGWVASNYAALACDSFPGCRIDAAWPPADFASGFAPWRELGATASGAPLPHAALTAIHLAHRLGALVVAVFVGVLAWRRYASGRVAAALLLGALLLQAGLGIASVLLRWPLAVAVAHNLGAATLLAALLVAGPRRHQALAKIR